MGAEVRDCQVTLENLVDLLSDSLANQIRLIHRLAARNDKFTAMLEEHSGIRVSEAHDGACIPPRIILAISQTQSEPPEVELTAESRSANHVRNLGFSVIDWRHGLVPRYEFRRACLVVLERL